MQKSLRQVVIRAIAGALIGVVLDEASQAIERYRHRGGAATTQNTPPRVEVLRGAPEAMDHVEAVAKKVIEWFAQSDASENIRELIHRTKEMESSSKAGSAASRFAESAVDTPRQAWQRRA